MNLEKFTERARGFLQSAQTVATRMNHQRIAPAHVLKALLEDEQGMAAAEDAGKLRRAEETNTPATSPRRRATASSTR
jgi:ATP-dependent Clp protease ATP-binding subunit ClpB